MNEHEIESMRNVFNNLRKKIEPLSESPKILKLRERVTKIRKDSIDNNEELLQTARQSFKENDIDLFYAEDDKQARDILLNLINEEIASNDNINPDDVFIAKSKSNTLK